ncbi:MAG: hypothetical protein ACK4IY_08270, partial [Chitinophagales bacterium]
LDEVTYMQFVESYKNTSTDSYFQYYDLIQPLIVLSFDENDSIQFFLRNCNVSGFPNFKWNRYGSFDNSPLLIHEGYLPDSTIGLNTFNTYSGFYLPLHQQQTIEERACTETIVVYWNKLMGRQRKRLIETVQNYIDNTKTVPCVYYVDTDNLFFVFSQQDEDK